MFFTAPLWLAALGALAVPIAIHFLSRGHQRRVRVGSIRLMQPAPGQRGRLPRLTEPWLLALRAGLLAALALALAAPRWWRAEASAEPRGWLLVAPEAARAMATNRALAERFEQLRQAGHEARRLVSGLVPGLPAMDTAASTPPRRDLWSLLREADTLAPPGAPFFVFADARAADLDGMRPSMRRRVEWLPVGVVAAVDAGLAGDLVPAAIEPPATIEPRAASRSQPLRVAIVANPARSTEALYVRAAFSALAASGDREVVVRSISSAELALGASVVDGALSTPSAGAAASHLDPRFSLDLLFYLDDEPLPAILAEQVRRGGVAVVAVAAFSVPCDRLLVAEIGGVEQRIALRRCATDSGLPGAALWRDDLGNAGLAIESLGSGLLLRHAGRFDVAAGDFVLAAAFPEWVRDLVALTRSRRGFADATAAAHGREDLARAPRARRGLADATAAAQGQEDLARAPGARRGLGAATTAASRLTQSDSVAVSQALPRSLSSETPTGASAPGLGQLREAGPWLWIFVALLFGTERLLAMRRSR